ncbi:MAG: AAA family ATPase [Muribaculaceae bacterium]|nr:AAA family ATPase [Muribaculaceae bacterium]
MITYIHINGFKSFRNFEMYFAPLTVIAGINAAGKSNLFDALSLLSSLASDASLYKALTSQRGELDELFTLYDNGERSKEISFTVEMLVNPSVTDEWGQSENLTYTRLRYALTLRKTGVDSIEIAHESLTPIHKTNDVWADYIPSKTSSFWRPTLKSIRKKPFLSVCGNDEDDSMTVNIYESSNAQETLKTKSVAKTFLSRFDKTDHPHLLAARQEMMSWRFLQLNPSDLRLPSYKSDSKDELDANGRHMASTLVRLKKEDEYNLVVISRLIRKFLPDFVEIDVKEEADSRRFTIYLTDKRGRTYSSRVLSEGTLRIIALCILAVDNHHSGLLCFEEPENGVHTSRLETMAKLMEQLSSDFKNTDFRLRQVIVNTHSPKFVEEIFKLRNKLSLVVLTRRVTSVINEGPLKTVMQITRMTPIVSDGKKVFPLSDQPSIQELNLNRQDMRHYLNGISIDDLLNQ